MSDLDLNLLHEARKFITGANVHGLRTWLFLYEVSLPNSPERLKYEKAIREFVHSARQVEAVRANAIYACWYSAEIRAKSDAINDSIDKVMGRKSR